MEDNNIEITVELQGKNGYHNYLMNRDLPNQHPISAIENLEAILDQLKKTVKENKNALDKVVSYKDFTYDGVERKTIELENHDSISGLDTEGNGHNLLMLSKENIADVGAIGVHLNLNTKDNITINGIDTIATKSYVDSIVVESSDTYTKSEINEAHKELQEAIDENTKAINSISKEDEVWLSMQDMLEF